MNRFFIILPAIFLFTSVVPAGADDGILGMWRSAELNTGSTPQLRIEDNGGSIAMDFWSTNGGQISSQPQRHQTDIPSARAKTLSVGDTSLKTAIIYNFKEVIYEVFKTESGLRLEAVHQYTDDSGRDTLTETLNFVPGTYRDAAKEGLGKDVPEEGWLGTWKNRDEGTRGIAQLLIQDLNPVMMSTWGIAGDELSSKRGSYVKLPLDSKEATTLTGKPEIEAAYDHGWATQTFTMELHEDGITLVSHMDYTDPERGEQQVEYEFVRGVWED